MGAPRADSTLSPVGPTAKVAFFLPTHLNTTIFQTCRWAGPRKPGAASQPPSRPSLGLAPHSHSTDISQKCAPCPAEGPSSGSAVALGVDKARQTRKEGLTEPWAEMLPPRAGPNWGVVRPRGNFQFGLSRGEVLTPEAGLMETRPNPGKGTATAPLPRLAGWLYQASGLYVLHVAPA